MIVNGFPFRYVSAAKRLRVGVETRPPQPVADDDHRMGVRRAVVVRREHPALRRANAEHVEVVAAGDFASDHAGVLIRSGGSEPCH